MIILYVLLHVYISYFCSYKHVHVPRKTFPWAYLNIFRILAKLVNRYLLLADQTNFKVFGLDASRLTVWPYGRPTRIVIVVLTGTFHFHFHFNPSLSLETSQSLHVGGPKVISKLSKVKSPSNLAFQKVSLVFFIDLLSFLSY